MDDKTDNNNKKNKNHYNSFNRSLSSTSSCGSGGSGHSSTVRKRTNSSHNSSGDGFDNPQHIIVTVQKQKQQQQSSINIKTTESTTTTHHRHHNQHNNNNINNNPVMVEQSSFTIQQQQQQQQTYHRNHTNHNYHNSNVSSSTGSKYNEDDDNSFRVRHSLDGTTTIKTKTTTFLSKSSSSKPLIRFIMLIVVLITVIMTTCFIYDIELLLLDNPTTTTIIQTKKNIEKQQQQQQQQQPNVDNDNGSGVVLWSMDHNGKNILRIRQKQQQQRKPRPPQQTKITTTSATTTLSSSSSILIPQPFDDGNDNILLVIISDRMEGIIATIGSVIQNSYPVLVDVVLITNDENEEEDDMKSTTTTTNLHDLVQEHFKSRIHQFRSYTMSQVQQDLLQYHVRYNNNKRNSNKQQQEQEHPPLKPVWMWDEWHSSIQFTTTNHQVGELESDPPVPQIRTNWTRMSTTVRTGIWDQLYTHAHVLNHVRFYLPYLSVFDNKEYFYFVDDDIIVIDHNQQQQNKPTTKYLNLGSKHERFINTVLPTFDKTKSLLCPCNGWLWNQNCLQFDFHNGVNQSSIYETSALYGNKPNCTTDDDIDCVPPYYWDWVKDITKQVTTNWNKQEQPPLDTTTTVQQKAWNFGFSMYVVDNWKNNGITNKYEYVMKESYTKHIYPELSLTFGLGIAYLALVDTVECWNDIHSYVIRDGFSYIDYDRYEQVMMKEQQEQQQMTIIDGSGTVIAGTNFLDLIDIIHYTGRMKPWFPNTTLNHRSVQPYLDVMKNEIQIIREEKEGASKKRVSVPSYLSIPDQLPIESTRNIFLVLGTIRSGVQWVSSLLDLHPDVCCTGENDKGSLGYPSDTILTTTQLQWCPTCSVKRGCSLSFVQKRVHDLIYESNYKRIMMNGNEDRTESETNVLWDIPYRCLPDYNPFLNHNDPFEPHLQRLCQFIYSIRNVTETSKTWLSDFRNVTWHNSSSVSNTYPYSNTWNDTVTRLWLEAFVQEDHRYLGCHCVRGVQAKGLKVITDWLHYRNYPHPKPLGNAYLNLNQSILFNDKMDNDLSRGGGNSRINTKIIHVKRNTTNLWVRYKSIVVAQLSNVYHVTTIQQKQNQLSMLQNQLLNNNNNNQGITINVRELDWYLDYASKSERAGDEWIVNQTSKSNNNVLYIDYNDCRQYTEQCFKQLYEFIGVDPDVIMKSSSSSSSSSTGSNTNELFQSSFYRAFPNNDYDNNYDLQLDQYINNKKEVIDVLKKYNLTLSIYNK